MVARCPAACCDGGADVMATKAVASGKTMAQSADYILPPSEKPAPPPGIELLDLHPTIGTEVLGIDLREALTPEMFAFLDALLVERKVIFFRDQDITARNHVDFARHWGELLVTPFSNNSHAEYGEIATINSDGTNARTNSWHSDGAWRAEPDLGSVVRAIAVPEVGGDTLFRDTHAAYVNMPDWLRRAVEGEEAVFSARCVSHDPRRADRGADPGRARSSAGAPSDHPHPSGLGPQGDLCRSVLCHAHRRHGLCRQPLSARAAVRTVQPARVPRCRFKWRNNSIAFWDNRGCQHYASADYVGQNFIRKMERVTIRGERPF